MNLDTERELWHIRFSKLVQFEEAALEFYEKTLKEKTALLEKYGLKNLVVKLVRDEERHVELAKELLAFTKALS